jgi:hypothetical protein
VPDALLAEIQAELYTLTEEIDTYEGTLPLVNLKELAKVWCGVTNGTRSGFLDLMRPILEPSLWLAAERNISKWWEDSVS